MAADGPDFDPARIIAVLDAHGVEYVIVGGFAAEIHGSRHSTGDLDLVPRRTDDNLSRLASALGELGARRCIGGGSDEEARRLPVTVDAATLGSATWITDAGPVDVLGELPVTRGARSYDDLILRAVPRCLHRVVVHVAALDDIVAGKELADRDTDRRALPELRQLQQHRPGLESPDLDV